MRWRRPVVIVLGAVLVYLTMAALQPPAAEAPPSHHGRTLADPS
jgi:hypothetical protein